MSGNPFYALFYPPDSNKPGQPRKELKKEEEELMQKKKHPERRGTVPQPDVATPHERTKMGLKKEEHVQTQKKPYEGRGRQFDRHPGTGRGREMKKGGAGGHNWGKAGDEATAPLPEKTPEPVDETKEETPAPVVEEDPTLTLEEFEKLKAQKRSGALFEPKSARQVIAEPTGTVYKRDENVGEGDYIKLGEDHDLKKKPGHFKHKEKKVLEIDYKVRDTSVPDAPRRSPREGGREGRGPRPPREDGGAPRGGRGGSRGGRGGARGSARGGASAPAGKIDTADQSAFPKLGGA